MTPDSLVNAVLASPEVHRGVPLVGDRGQQKAVIRKVLAAAFAALPECEEVVMAVAKAMPHGWTDDYGMRHSVVSKGNYDDAKAYIAALAREFGEPTP